MEYTEFLKLPEIEDQFKSMLNEQQEYYMTKRFDQGFDKEHRELMSIKMAFITTDLYFTDMHNAKSKAEE